MLTIGPGLAGLPARRIAGGTPSPPGLPTNLELPYISGSPVDGTAWTLHLGAWAGTVTSFDIEVRTIEGTPVVLLSRQTVTADTTGTISGAVGKSIELRVWAINGDGETLSTSAAFGPVVAAGDTFVLGLAVNTAEQSLPSSPYPFINVTGATLLAAVVKQGSTTLASSAIYPVANPNTGMSGLNFGWNGTSDTGGTSTISSATFTDSKLKGRISGNLSQSQSRLRIDLPAAGVYRIYAGLGVSGSTANVNIGVWDGNPTTTSLHQMGPVSDSDSSTSIVDINGNVTTVAAWAAADGPGMGTFVEVTVGAGAFITVAKSTNASSSTPNWCAIAVFKKV